MQKLSIKKKLNKDIKYDLINDVTPEKLFEMNQ